MATGPVDRILEDVDIELAGALQAYPPFHSAHEAYAALLEEVDELWEQVKHRPTLRNPAQMRHEAIQVAAMAVRFVLDVVPDDERDD